MCPSPRGICEYVIEICMKSMMLAIDFHGCVADAISHGLWSLHKIVESDYEWKQKVKGMKWKIILFSQFSS